MNAPAQKLDPPVAGPAQDPVTAAPLLPSAWQPPPLRAAAVALIVLLAVAAVLAILAAWQLPPFSRGIQITENAYVRGSTSVVAPEVSGYVVAVEVKDYDAVLAGQVLVRIDDRIYKARVAAARATLDTQVANLTNSRAQLAHARADMKRVDELVRDGSVSIRERDQTLAALRQAEAQARLSNGGPGSSEAQVAAARAQLSLAEIDLDHTVIRAAEDGRLGEVGVRLGQYVTNGTQLMAVVPTRRWVIANYKEAQTARMASGQKASFTVDALGGASFTGRIERLAPATGSEFAVLKPDNATGNFVKVPQRIGVLIAIDPGQPFAERLGPGMSVEARIETQ